MLIGEAFGRVEVPLADLPDGVAAYTIPRKGEDGSPRIPVDHKRRLNPTEADLIATRPGEAFTPPAGLSTAELGWILETGTVRRWETVKRRLGERAWAACVNLMLAGGVVIRCDVRGRRDWEPRTLRLTQSWAAQAADLLREVRGLPVPSAARADLVALMAGIPELADESALLEAIPDDEPLGFPRGTRTRAGAWTTYEAAIRAACYWYQHQEPDRRLTAKEVAAHALGGSKAWTAAGKTAFENLLDQPFDLLLDEADHDIRVCGPLRWTVTTVAADASQGHPWIGLPSRGIHVVGHIEHKAAGVLVVENSDTFQTVCLHGGITDRWLCVWGRGSTTDGVIAFLNTMADVPIAVWGDLDAYGIQIVCDLARRLDRSVNPIGMTVDLYASGKNYIPDNLPKALRTAEKMAVEAIDPLRDLAAAIVAAGGLGCEHESRYVVLRTLSEQLSRLE